MIGDLDETIRQLLIEKVPLDPDVVEIMFERPNSEWESRLGTKPTVNCFLHDIRENLQLRYDQQQTVTRAGDGRKGTIRRTPARVDFKYLITVWAAETLDEHQILGRILQALLRFQILPTEILQGELVEQSLPVRAWAAQPEDIPQVWEFWGANEWRLKASLSYRVTLTIEHTPPVDVDLVRETQTRLTLKQEAGAPETEDAV